MQANRFVSLTVIKFSKESPVKTGVIKIGKIKNP
jgi:hypothetical protein